jgi:predicted dinucleotide-binding enzyme
MACAGETLDRVALPISGDNPKAKEIVAQLIDRIGFDSVDAGQSLSRGGNNLELLFTAPIRRRRNFSCG